MQWSLLEQLLGLLTICKLLTLDYRHYLGTLGRWTCQHAQRQQLTVQLWLVQPSNCSEAATHERDSLQNVISSLVAGFSGKQLA